MIKRITIALFIGFFLSLNTLTAMVSFFVVETGLPESREETSQALLWENAFLDVFFEAGFIVSNAPVARLHTIPQNNLLEAVALDFTDARSMGIDYILIAILDFDFDLQSPSEISFYIYNVSQEEKILERQIPGRTYGSEREEFDDLKAIARGLVPIIRQ